MFKNVVYWRMLRPDIRDDVGAPALTLFITEEANFTAVWVYDSMNGHLIVKTFMSLPTSAAIDWAFSGVGQSAIKDAIQHFINEREEA
jgi:hypothetical protein